MNMHMTLRVPMITASAAQQKERTYMHMVVHQNSNTTRRTHNNRRNVSTPKTYCNTMITHRPVVIKTNAILFQPFLEPYAIHERLSDQSHHNKQEMDHVGKTKPCTEKVKEAVPRSIQMGGGTKMCVPNGEPDLGPNNDLYTPFSSNGLDWLSSNHILKCVTYRLHMQYPNAKHQNMGGITHPVPSVDELLHKMRQAGGNSPLEHNTDIAQVMRDTLSPEGPSPAITFGDNIHWRVMLINAKTKHVDLIDPFGTGFLHTVRTGVQNFYKRDKTGTWTFTEWATRLQPTEDTWNCGIWAIWIQEKWMQFWSQTGETAAFADWLGHDTDMSPKGQDLRQHYRTVMQLASAIGEDGRTDLGKSKEISSCRMANHRDRQALYEEYTARTLSDPNADTSQGGTEASKPQQTKFTALQLYKRSHPTHTTKGRVNTESQGADKKQKETPLGRRQQPRK